MTPFFLLSTLTSVRKFSRCVSFSRYPIYYYGTCVNSIAGIISSYVQMYITISISAKGKTLFRTHHNRWTYTRHLTRHSKLPFAHFGNWSRTAHSGSRLNSFFFIYTWDFWRLGQASIIDRPRKDIITCQPCCQAYANILPRFAKQGNLFAQSSGKSLKLRPRKKGACIILAGSVWSSTFCLLSV